MGQVPSLWEQGTGCRHHEQEAVGQRRAKCYCWGSQPVCPPATRISAQEVLLMHHHSQ